MTEFWAFVNFKNYEGFMECNFFSQTRKMTKKCHVDTDYCNYCYQIKFLKLLMNFLKSFEYSRFVTKIPKKHFSNCD